MYGDFGARNFHWARAWINTPLIAGGMKSDIYCSLCFSPRGYLGDRLL